MHLTTNDQKTNLVPRAFLRRGDGGQKKTLASADHVTFKHLENLGVIKWFFITDEELRGEFKDLFAVKAVFPNISVIPYT